MHDLSSLSDIAEVLTRLFGQVTSTIAGEMPLERWARAASRVGRDVAKRLAAKENLKYMGGYITFRMSPRKRNLIDGAIELYFLDRAGSWRKAVSVSEIRAANFDRTALAEIRSEGGVAFELT